MLIPLSLPKSLQPRPPNTERTLQPLNLYPQILSEEGAREDGEGTSALLPSRPTGTVRLPILLATGWLSGHHQIQRLLSVSVAWIPPAWDA